MPQFVLAFPLNVTCDEPFKVTDFVSIDKDTANVIIPGCGVQFNVVRQAAAAGLLGLFAENDSITPEESAVIDAHKSLLFLLGEVKSIDDVSQVDSAILKILAAGALGVYMQQSGTAWTAARFREVLGDAEFPMDTWINFVEGTTLSIRWAWRRSLCPTFASRSRSRMRKALCSWLQTPSMATAFPPSPAPRWTLVKAKSMCSAPKRKTPSRKTAPNTTSKGYSA
jgi:hypothetical protein